MARSRAFCADASRDNAEPLGATASRVDNWLLVEYRGLWGHDALGSSGLSDEVKRRLRELSQSAPVTKLLFVRRTERRHHGGLLVYWGTSREHGARLQCREIERYEDLLSFDLASPGDEIDHPLLLVCTHGKHDRCCARYGRPLYAALREGVEDGWVWQASHVGGDRFAGNVVVLPEGLYFGRVAPADAWPVLEDYLAGRIRLEHYRGRCCHPFPVQAAEHRLREATGLTGIDDLTLVAAERDGARWRVRFRTPSSEEHDVAVTPGFGELTYLTCADETLMRPRRYDAEILRGPGA